MKHFILFICFCWCSNGFAQFSALESKAGETSILVAGNGVFINTGDASVGISYTSTEFKSGKGTTFGASAKGTAASGKINILTQSKLKAQFDLNVFLQQTISDVSKLYITNIYCLFDYGRAKYNILETPNSTEFTDKLFSRYYGALGINHFGKRKDKQSYYIMGASISYGLFNNTLDLDAAQQYTLNNPLTTSAPQNIVFSSSKAGIAYGYKESDGANISLDFYTSPEWLNNKNLAFGGFGRCFAGYKYSTAALGPGIVLGATSNPKGITLGIFYQFKYADYLDGGFNQSLNITSGYTF